MSNANEIGFSIFKTMFEPEPNPLPHNEPSQTNNQLTAPPLAAQERTGLSGNLQNFLSLRSLNFSGTGGAFVARKPPQPSGPPAFPGAPLFSKGAGDADEVNFNDVNQGNFGDCYLMSSLAAIAKDNPQAIRNMVRENRDDKGSVTSYTVGFYQRDNGVLGTGLFGGGYKKVEITVAPSEIFKDGAHAADNGEIWVKVIETGFAKYKGGVDNIKNGGNPSDTLQILTGSDSRTYQTNPGWFDKSYSFDNMKADLNKGEEIVISSKGDSKKMTLSGYGIHGDHAYMVQSVYTDASGKQMVQLYNPWGFDHPKPIPFNELNKYFVEIGVN